MARYKTLQGVCHDLAQSFLSTLNYFENDYAMGHLVRIAHATGQPRFCLNLIDGEILPVGLLTSEFANDVRSYARWFSRLLASHDSDISVVAAANLIVRFELSKRRPSLFPKGYLETPYVCRVEIQDNRGKLWHFEQSGWWAPAPVRLGAIALLRARLRTWLKGFRLPS